MIIRKKIDANYTRIPNTPDDYLNDPSITAKSKGILTQLLSKPDTWRLSVTYLVSTNKEGPSAIRSAINELIRSGYIHREVVRDEHGRIRGTQHIIFDHRASLAEARAVVSLQGESPLETVNTRCPNVGSQEQASYKDIISTPSEVHSSNLENEHPIEADQPQCQDLSSAPTMEAASHIDAQPPASTIKTQMEDINHQPDNRMQKTQIRENATVVKNKGSNKLGVVTTTTPAESALEPEPAIDVEVLEPSSSSSYPATEDIDSLLDLIPEHHRKPTVEKLVREALGHHDSRQVKEAVMYAADNVRGGWLQFRAYLDKALQNGWAAGYLDHQADPAAAWMDTGTMVPAVVNQGRQRARFANGSITGSHRMDDNYRAGMEFMMMMGVEV